MAAASSDANELPHRVFPTMRDVADRSAVTHHRVETAVCELREVEDVGDDAVGDSLLQGFRRYALAIRFELSRREVDDDDLGADPRELDREPAGPSAGVEDAVTGVNEPAEVVQVNFEARMSVLSAFLEAVPFTLAVLVEKRGGPLGSPVNERAPRRDPCRRDR